MFCAPGLIFHGSEGVGSRFHFLRFRTRFRRYRGRQIPFSCFTLADSFSAVPRVLAPVFLFYAPGLVFGGTEDVVSRFHILRSRTHFRGYRGRRVLFSCFALPASLSTVLWVSAPAFKFCAPVFMFCALELIFGGTNGVGSRFNVLRSLARFRRCGGRRVPFSCFAILRLIFGGIENVGSRFHVLRPRTHFRRFRGRRVPF
jgi:hypothetical protein